MGISTKKWADGTCPRHVAIIMDGNGRWARARHLPRIEGHRQGAKAVRRVVEAMSKHPIEYLTLFAFSVENWQRPADEVEGLMDMLVSFLAEHQSVLVKNRIRFNVVGRISDLPERVQAAIQEVVDMTAEFEERTLTLALSYGSRTEILDAFAACHEALLAGEIPHPPASYDQLRPFLYTRDLPDPDLIIRTSGEWRVSNFLLLQSAYAEFYFSQVPWPEFNASHLQEALNSYASRERRFGLTGDQLLRKPLPEPVLVH